MKKVLLVFLLAVWMQAAFADSASVGFVDARQQGSFNIGAAQASMSRIFAGEPINHDVVVVDYQLPGRTVAGVWANEFPAGLAEGQTDVLDVGIYLPEATIR